MNGWLIYDQKGLERNRWFIETLCVTATEEGLNLHLIKAELLSFGIKNGNTFLAYNGREVCPPDFALVRTIAPLLSLQLEKMGVRLFNSAKVSTICNDKRITHLCFADIGVPMADTAFLESFSTDFAQFDYPSVLKSSSGHGGSEVFLVSSKEDAAVHAGAFHDHHCLLQKPVTLGKDVRVYLLDGEILATFERCSATDFRSNFSLGGTACLTTPTPDMLNIIKKVIRQLSPWFVGVDFTFDQNGTPLLNEIEDIVGMRMLYKFTDIEIHRHLILSLKNHLA